MRGNNQSIVFKIKKKERSILFIHKAIKSLIISQYLVFLVQQKPNRNVIKAPSHFHSIYFTPPNIVKK
jgi:hypothetical protein